MKLTPEQLNALVERIQGTTDYLGFVTQEMFGTEDLDITTCQELDTIIFQCEGCGWWMEQSEMTDNPEKDWNCRECAGDER